MKRFFLLLFLASSISNQAQHKDNRRKGEELKKLVFTDSALKKIQAMKDSAAAAIRTIDIKRTEESISLNMDGLVQLQKDLNARKKKAAIIRIAIGIALLVVLVIGLRRKGKK